MKRILIVMAICIALTLSWAIVASAAGPTTVTISGSSANINTGVIGTLSSGTVDWSFDGSTATTTMTGITGGNLMMGASGLNAIVGPYQPIGAVGGINNFTASGSFNGTYQDNATGSYGNLTTHVNVTGNAGFQMNDIANLDVLSANHEYGLVGDYTAIATGTNAAMNLASYNWGASPGGWQEATNPYSSPCLQGQYIEKYVDLYKNLSEIAQLDVNVSTTGTATMANSNIWGWGVSEGTSGSGLATTNYGGGTRTVTATGNGTYNQTGYGANLLDFNGFTLGGGGSMSIIANFVGGISGTYTMDAK